MKLNKSLKTHMALTLHKRIEKQKERGHQVPQKKWDYFLFWLSQAKMTETAVMQEEMKEKIMRVPPHKEAEFSGFEIKDEEPQKAT